MTLNELKINQSAKIISVGGQGALRQHLLDMGLIPGTQIKMVRTAPMGDPLEFRIYDYELTIRFNDASCIEIQPVENENTNNVQHNTENFLPEIEHPGLGGQISCP